MGRSATSPEGRLSEALQAGEASEATVQLKHFSKSLQSSHLTQPAQVSENAPFCTETKCLLCDPAMGCKVKIDVAACALSAGAPNLHVCERSA